MYRIERTPRLKDTLELCYEDKVLRVDVDVDINSAMERYNRARADINRIKRQGPSADYEEFGRAVLTLFSVFFGEKATEEIVNFYENNAAEMLEDIFPYINSVLAPKLAEASRAKREKLRSMYRGRRRW